MFTNALQFIASGAVLYVLLGMALVLVIWAVWKLPLLISTLLWPTRWAMNWIDQGPVGTYVKQTRPWLWLQKRQYDPKGHPLTWWATRGALVLALWAGSLAWALQHGKEVGRDEGRFAGSLALIGSDAIPSRVSSEWKNRALSCETQLSNMPLEIPSVKIPEAVVVTTAPPDTVVKAKDVKKAYRKPKKTWLEELVN